MRILNGKKANGGIAVGKAFVIASTAEAEKRAVTDIGEEKQKLVSGIEKVQGSYEALLERLNGEGNKVSADIIEAQLAILLDPVLLERINGIIDDGVCAEYAAAEAGNETAKEFSLMDSEYMRARSADVLTVTRKISDAVMGNDPDKAPDAPSVVFAEALSPEQLIRIGKEYLLAIVTRDGSAVSHTSILAGTYGIPYVFGADFDADEVNGRQIAVDADSGTVFIEPDAETENGLISRDEEEKKAEREAKDKALPVKLYANISVPDDIEAVLSSGAQGIGLFRTEFLFMNRKELPGEQEQFEAYKKVIEGMNGRDVIIRTMDIGTDKQTDCLTLPHEENPQLGRRAIRICLEDKELFGTQLRALLRASVFGKAMIMYPMITSDKELDDIFREVENAARELEARGEKYAVPPQGIMIETPAAAMISDILAKKVDFFSVGTNDLTQYTLALDRTGEGLDRFYDPYHEAVFRLIALTVKNAHENGATVGVCGELAGDTKAALRLVECGVDELSMSPSKISKLRAALARSLPQEIPLGAPADGDLIPQEDIPDAAFSSGALGKCIAVEPKSGEIYAPCDGTVTMIADTYHAFAIETDDGREVLIHIGIDTVTLGGKGFKCGLSVGRKVTKGELLMTADIGYIRKKGLSAMVIMACDER